MNMQSVDNSAKLQRFIVCMFIIVTLVSFSQCKAFFNHEECEQKLQTHTPFCMQDHYQKVCNRIINVWSVLDVMRSINIEPKARVDFIHQLFSDVIMAMREVVTLEVACRISSECGGGEYGNHCSEEMYYFFDMVDHLKNAFEAVFTPIIFGEEKLLALLMVELFEGVKNIKQTFSI